MYCYRDNHVSDSEEVNCLLKGQVKLIAAVFTELQKSSLGLECSHS